MPKGKVGFDKGDPNINREGRPVGSLNKKKIRWNNLQDLAEWAQETLEGMKPEKVLEYIQHKESLLIPKLGNIPATPDQSKSNVDDDQKLLDDASRTPSISDQPRLDEGLPQVQAGAQTERGV